MRFCCGWGISLVLATILPAWAEQVPSAVAPEGIYRITPHRPTTQELVGEDMSFSPHKPPDTLIGAQDRPIDPIPIMPQRLQSEPAAPQHMSMNPEHDRAAGSPPLGAGPVPATIPQTTSGHLRTEPSSPQSQAISEDKRIREGEQRRWHHAHPRPYGANMQLSPTIGLGAACVNGSVTICGKSVPAPAGPIGAVANLTVPFPYVPQPFMAQCLAVGGVPAYRIVDATQVSCEVQTCAPSEVTICGARIGILSSVKVGQQIKVQVPSSSLGNAASAYAPEIRARCAEGANGTATYRVENESEISCNQFPCQTANVRLCDTAIEIPGGSPSGSVLTLAMPPPYHPDRFVVQCLGTMGRQPVYQIIDHEGVTCARAN